MKKIFLIVGLLIISTVTSADQMAGNQAHIERPVAPTNSCGQFDYRTHYGQYTSCIATYNRDVVVYQNQVNAFNNLNYQNPNSQITTNGNGLLATPTPPQNTCGSNPPVSDAGAYQTWNNCNSNYQAQLNAYNQSKATYDNINNQISQSATLQAQQNAQKNEAERLARISDETVTGSLNQVQNNNQGASKIYTVAAAALAGYAAYSLASGYTWSSSCGPWSVPSCVAAAAAFAAAVVYTSLNKKANNQVASLAENKVKVCQAQNQLSGTQANCQFTTPGSPVAIPEIVTPPDSTWYDPVTAQCKPQAPQLCKDIQNGDNGYKPNGMTVPKITTTCNGGGVSCMAGSGMTITDTAKGKKYSIKGKDGKEYSFYEKDLTTEAGMIAAGMTPAAAKKLAGELSLIDSTTNSKLATGDEKKAGDEKDPLSALNAAGGAGAFGTGAFGADGLDAAARARKFKDNLNAAKVLARKPSAAIGLNKDFHGDLIGLADDDIFGMMNRRYQLKDEQDTFIAPVP